MTAGAVSATVVSPLVPEQERAARQDTRVPVIVDIVPKAGREEAIMITRIGRPARVAHPIGVEQLPELRLFILCRAPDSVHLLVEPRRGQQRQASQDRRPGDDEAPECPRDAAEAEEGDGIAIELADDEEPQLLWQPAQRAVRAVVDLRGEQGVHGPLQRAQHRQPLFLLLVLQLRSEALKLETTPGTNPPPDDGTMRGIATHIQRLRAGIVDS